MNITKQDQEFIRVKKSMRPYIWIPVIERTSGDFYFIKLENITEGYFFIVKADFKTIKKEQTSLLGIVNRFEFLFNTITPKNLILANHEETAKIKPLEDKFSRMEKLYQGHLTKEIDF